MSEDNRGLSAEALAKAEASPLLASRRGTPSEVEGRGGAPKTEI